MQVDSTEKGGEHQSDGRLTIVLMFIFLMLLFLSSHHSSMTTSIQSNNMCLAVTTEKLLYLEQDEKSNKHPEALPLSYYPFFFLPLPINSAGKEMLMTIKGIGPALAETIVTHRNKVGPIQNIGDLQGVPGIGRKRATSLATELVFDKTE